MLILHDPDTLLHETVELLGAKLIPALESPKRLESILTTLHDSEHEVRTINTADESSMFDLLVCILETHDTQYLDHLETAHGKWVSQGLIKENESILPECFRFPTTSQGLPGPPNDIFARPGYYAFDMSSGITKNTYKAVIAFANLAYAGTKILSEDALSSEEPRNVFALCRPPGHHCDGHRAGGYCYVNNASVAISTWRGLHPDTKIGILDIDFHHGNGTQEIFYRDPGVLYTSIHGQDEFPYYTGAEDETGADEGEGMNVNLPLKTGSSFEEYMQKLEIILTRLEDHNADLLIVSLGFDTFHLDPLGSFKIDTEDYEVIARTARRRLRDMPALILLEGGYVLEHLGGNVLSFLRGWEDT